MTSFKAEIIVGSGSANFEIIRDLVELLLVVAPRWIKKKSAHCIRMCLNTSSVVSNRKLWQVL